MAAVHPRPTSAPARPRAASVPARLAVALAAVLVLTIVGAAPATARRAQDPGASTTLPFEASTTTEAPATTVEPAPTVTETDTVPATGTGSRRVADENRKIWGVVGGLVLVAIALSLLTIRYWRKTRPVPPTTGLMLPTDAALALALASTPESEMPTPESPAAVSPEPEPVPTPEPAAEPAASPPAASGDLLDDPVYDAANDTAPVPVVEAPPAEPASARRAVAGADHAAADEAWEPRGTGEHERVVLAATARANRLTPEQRAALFAQRTPPQP